MSEEVKKIIYPCIALRGLNILPKTTLHFDVGREKSIAALNKAMEDDKILFISTQMDESTLITTFDDIYKLGTLVKVKQMLRVSKETIHVIVEGISRVEYDEVSLDNDMLSCTVNNRPDLDEGMMDSRDEAILRKLSETGIKYMAEMSDMKQPGFSFLFEENDPVEIINKLIMSLRISPSKKQSLYEIDFIMDRAEALLGVISEELEIMKEEKNIEEILQASLDKTQKEYVLKEKMKVIQEELGDGDSYEEAENWKKELETLELDERTNKKILKEINRYARIPSMSPDSNVVRTYIETILDLPWKKSSVLEDDLLESKKVLDKDHYGMKKVKERIIEQLAVMKLSEKYKGSIICLVGPPGVGKTSIARSIAEATGRKFTRMSLGGVRDEAEIRGHRRTYIGSRPGSIISNLKGTEVNNPLFLLDEIDKLGSDFRGDPASALLEVLDPEQNNTFTDHYLDVPFDLSNILFITTANTTSTIPRPLLDRMEVIQVSGYTEDEKVNIAEKYLIPKGIKAHGMTKDNIKFSKSAVENIVRGYTRESGVRNLEREISKICRKVATLIVTTKKEKFNITEKNINKYLGKIKFRPDEIEGKSLVGVVNGMAWTQVGGTTLQVEVINFPGTGKIQLTGKLGDVMKESATAAASYIKSKSKDLNIDDEFFVKNDIHIHVPEGAVPKDGPSAGVTMFTALVSAITNVPVKQDVAMTGEITLRGKVLPVGGIKEKVLAAHRSGARTILLPKDNVADLEEIPSSVLKELKIVPLDYAMETLEHTLVEPREE